MSMATLISSTATCSLSYILTCKSASRSSLPTESTHQQVLHTEQQMLSHVCNLLWQLPFLRMLRTNDFYGLMIVCYMITLSPDCSKYYAVSLITVQEDLLTRTIHWCGRILSAKGIKHDSKRLDGLLNMDPPTTGGQLLQLVSAMQWLQSSTPKFQAMVSRFHHFKETVYKYVGKRTKRGVPRARLRDIGWTSELSDAFLNCQKAIAQRVTLAHLDSNKSLCVYTDASDSHWPGILMQVPIADLADTHANQRHDPLTFHSRWCSPRPNGLSHVLKRGFCRAHHTWSLPLAGCLPKRFRSLNRP